MAIAAIHRGLFRLFQQAGLFSRLGPAVVVAEDVILFVTNQIVARTVSPALVNSVACTKGVCVRNAPIRPDSK